MPAKAGKFPWNNISEKTKTGRHRATLRSGNYEWDLSEGWHLRRARGWKGSGRANGNIEKVKHIAPDGTEVTVYKTKGYDDTIGFHSHDMPTDDVMAFVTSAFNKEDPSHGPLYEQEGCGHIAKLEYAQRDLVLRVTFTNNGAVCVFLGVPTAVAGELLALARSKVTRISSVTGTSKHALGMVFWDLVRIRGQKHGSRYPFEYEQTGVYKLTGRSRRYTVTLSDENYKRILGEKYVGPPLKPGDKVRAILSETEYAKYQEEVHQRAQSAVKQAYSEDGELIDYSGVEDSLYESVRAGGNGKSLQDILGPEYSRYLDLQNRFAMAQNDAVAAKEAENQEKMVKNVSEQDLWAKFMADPKYNGNLSKIADAVIKAAAEMADGSSLVDKRKGLLGDKASANKVAVMPSHVFEDKKDLNDYLRYESLLRKADNPAKYATGYVGRPWTMQTLKDFANPTIPGAISVEHATLYKRLIQSGDYEAALNFLKNHKHDVVYENSKTGHKTTLRKPYASQYDFLSKTEE